jgi:ribosomal protein S17E
LINLVSGYIFRVQKREEWKEKNKMGGYIHELLRMQKASVGNKTQPYATTPL